jgi:hypothetical protein
MSLIPEEALERARKRKAAMALSEEGLPEAKSPAAAPNIVIKSASKAKVATGDSGSSSTSVTNSSSVANSPASDPVKKPANDPAKPPSQAFSYLLDQLKCKEVMKLSKSPLVALAKALDLDSTRPLDALRIDVIRFCGTSDNPIWEPDTPKFKFPKLVKQDFLVPAAQSSA